MKLLKALSLSEELNCKIIQREAGIQLKHDELGIFDLTMLPSEGWELADDPQPLVFIGKFLGSSLVENFTPDATSFVFTGNHKTLMPVPTRVKVTIEPWND